jgi:hypothetical protein
MKSRSVSLSVLLLVLLSSFSYAQAPAAPIPHIPPYFAYQFRNAKEVEEALRTANIVKVKDLGTGITKPLKFTLDTGKFQFAAVFKTVDERKSGLTKLATSVEMDFKDSWMFEVAAYELDKLLGLNMVPVTVERTYNGKKGSLQLWVEDAITEKARKEKNLQALDVKEWNQQIFKVRVFDNLIYNIDRNLGNLLITSDWKIYMIDHSRCFKNLDILMHAGDMSSFSRSLLDSLKKLDEKNVKEHCGKYLTGIEIKMMLKRRDQILELSKRLKSEKGDTIFYP